MRTKTGAQPMHVLDQGQTLEEIQESLELPTYGDWFRYDEHFKLNIEGRLPSSYDRHRVRTKTGAQPMHATR